MTDLGIETSVKIGYRGHPIPRSIYTNTYTQTS